MSRFILTAVLLFSASSLVPAQDEFRTDGTLTEKGGQLYIGEGLITVQDPDLERRLRRLVGRTVSVGGDLSRESLAVQRVLGPGPEVLEGRVSVENGVAQLRRPGEPSLLLTGHPLLSHLDGREVMLHGWNNPGFSQFVVNAIGGTVKAEGRTRRPSSWNPYEDRVLSVGEPVEVLHAEAWSPRKGNGRWASSMDVVPLADGRAGDISMARAVRPTGEVVWFPLGLLDLGRRAPDPAAEEDESETPIPEPPYGNAEGAAGILHQSVVAGKVPTGVPPGVDTTPPVGIDPTVPTGIPPGVDTTPPQRIDPTVPTGIPPGVDTSPPPPASAGIGNHAVETGDSLYSIAKQYRDQGVTTPELMAANGLWPPNTTIRPGDELRIPKVSGRTEKMVVKDDELHHWIQEGNTLDRVARMYGVEPDRLRELNPGLKGFRAGDLLRLPPDAVPQGDTSKHETLTYPAE